MDGIAGAIVVAAIFGAILGMMFAGHHRHGDGCEGCIEERRMGIDTALEQLGRVNESILEEHYQRGRTAGIAESQRLYRRLGITRDTRVDIGPVAGSGYGRGPVIVRPAEGAEWGEPIASAAGINAPGIGERAGQGFYTIGADRDLHDGRVSLDSSPIPDVAAIEADAKLIAVKGGASWETLADTARQWPQYRRLLADLARAMRADRARSPRVLGEAPAQGVPYPLLSSVC